MYTFLRCPEQSSCLYLTVLFLRRTNAWDTLGNKAGTAWRHFSLLWITGCWDAEHPGNVKSSLLFPLPNLRSLPFGFLHCRVFSNLSEVWLKWTCQQQCPQGSKWWHGPALDTNCQGRFQLWGAAYGESTDSLCSDLCHEFSCSFTPETFFPA